MPMANTVVDLWRMMYDYNCTSIVQLNAMDPDDEVTINFLVILTSTYGPGPYLKCTLLQNHVCYMLLKQQAFQKWSWSIWT